VLYRVWCLSKLYAQENNCKKQFVEEKKGKGRVKKETNREEKHHSTD
jgi:hypothetical protein